MIDVTELGRTEGLWIMVHDVPAHLACGWRVVDDCRDGGPRGFMLLQPPIDLGACLTMPGEGSLGGRAGTSLTLGGAALELRR